MHANAHSRNEKRILDWYNDCVKMGLLPEEFMIKSEDQEIQIEKKQSFHKKRKEEWRKRQTSKNKFKVEDTEKKEDKKPHFFKGAKTKPGKQI